MVHVIPVIIIGLALFFGMRRIFNLVKSAFTALLVVAILLALYKFNGGDWGNVAVSIISIGLGIVDWLSDQFVGMWQAVTDRFL